MLPQKNCLRILVFQFPLFAVLQFGKFTKICLFLIPELKILKDFLYSVSPKCSMKQVSGHLKLKKLDAIKLGHKYYKGTFLGGSFYWGNILTKKFWQWPFLLGHKDMETSGRHLKKSLEVLALFLVWYTLKNSKSCRIFGPFSPGISWK